MLKAYHDQGSPPKSSVDQAMDFFHGLDNGRQPNFKVNYLNSLQVKFIDPPESLNEMFTLANNWLKLKSLSGGGYGSTYTIRSRRKMKIVGAEQARRREGQWQETREEGQT